MIRKQILLQLIEVSGNYSSNSINMMIGGILSMISQVLKKNATKDTPIRMNIKIKLFLSYLNIVSTSL